MWLLDINQAQNNRQGTMHGAAQPLDEDAAERLTQGLLAGVRPVDWEPEGARRNKLIQTIRDAIEGGSSLNLQGHGAYRLTELPPEIGLLTHLEKLYLNNNNLTELPAEIGQLTNLKYLGLNRNKLTKLPPEIGQLENLQHLLLAYNDDLEELPPIIGGLELLEHLQLDDEDDIETEGDITLRRLKKEWSERQPLIKPARAKFPGKGGC